MRRPFVWISLVLCWIVIAGIAVQLYLIAAWIFGESGALDAHKFVGGAIVHPAEILVFLVSLGAWWGRLRSSARKTPATPGIDRAATTSTPKMWACGMMERTNTARSAPSMGRFSR